MGESILLYQFLSSRNAITNLERKMIKVSRIKGVNDIFELQPYLRIGKEIRKQFGKVRNKVNNIYGMVCFSTEWREPIMWGHYADSNKGIALGFSFESKQYEIKEVKYPTEKRRLSLDPLTITPTEYINALGHIKYKGWEYEKEHRLFVKLRDCITIEGNYFFRLSNHLKLKQVIIGPQHPYRCRDYRQQASYLIGLVKDAGAEIIVSRPEFGRYRLTECGTWSPKFKKLLTT